VRRTNARGVQAWIDRTPPTGERLEGEAAAAEGLWLGLRLLRGLDVDAFLRRFVQVDRAWLHARVTGLVARGDLQWVDDGRQLRVAAGVAAAPDPARGPADPAWLRHDSIAAQVLATP
jgi:oxygen-independent coproporphyrinogen-3 oxidase